MKKIAIEGINGAGKTPTCELVVNSLNENGLTVHEAAPYHLVRDKLGGKDIYPLWRENPKMAVKLMHETLNEVEEAAADKDILLYDRHWATAFTNADSTPEIVPLWGDRFVPTILMTSPTGHLLRLAQRGYDHAWLQADTLTHYRERYETVHAENIDYFIGKFTVSSADQDLRAIAHEISSTIIALD